MQTRKTRHLRHSVMLVRRAINSRIVNDITRLIALKYIIAR